MSYRSVSRDTPRRYHPRKQEILNRIMKMKNFRPLYIKLCSTSDHTWIDVLSSVIDKIDKTWGNSKDLILWIILSCGTYTDISDSAISHVKSKSFRCMGCLG